MAKALIEKHIPISWRLEPGDTGETVTLILRHKSIAEFRANPSTKGGSTLALALSHEMVRELVDILTGAAAATPRPDRYDA